MLGLCASQNRPKPIFAIPHIFAVWIDQPPDFSLISLQSNFNLSLGVMWFFLAKMLDHWIRGNVGMSHCPTWFP